MYYVYFIKSLKSNNWYIGYTNDIEKRLKEHNSGDTFTTKKYMPWFPVYLEGCFSEEDAKYREKILKQYGKVYSQLKRRIQKSILDAQRCTKGAGLKKHKFYAIISLL